MALSRAWSHWGKGNLNWGGTSGARRSSGPKSEFPEDTCFNYLLEGRTTEDERTNRKLKRQVILYGEIGQEREEAWRLNQSKRYSAPVKARKVANAYAKILMRVEEARALYKEFAGQPGLDPIEVPGHLADPLPE